KGPSIMHNGRQSQKLCKYPCPGLLRDDSSSVKYSGRMNNITCGGVETYSVYIEQSYHLKHGHLLHYQIEFSSCQKWQTIGGYEMSIIDIPKSGSDLNTVERCAALCLDQNATTKYLAFNSDDKCICILGTKTLILLQNRALYVSTLPNSTCDRYCNDSSPVQTYRCGSKKDPKIFAVYLLNGSCPETTIFVSELGKCVTKQYSGYYSGPTTCSPPMKEFVYDGSIAWSAYLRLLKKLELHDERVLIEFADHITPNNSWQCGLTTTTIASTTGDDDDSPRPIYRIQRPMWSQFRTSAEQKRYLVYNSCLRDSESLSYYYSRSGYRVCIMEPVEKFSSSSGSDNNNSSYIISISQLNTICPHGWLDINHRCFRMTKQKKSMASAKNVCISNQDEDKVITLMGIVDDVQRKTENERNAGRPLEYQTEWEAKIGFYLLDKQLIQDKKDSNDDNTNANEDATLAPFDYDYPISGAASSSTQSSSSASLYPVLEYYVSDINDNNSSLVSDNKCMLVSRMSEGDIQLPKITVAQLTLPLSTQRSDCTEPRHVLCETSPVFVERGIYECYQKPLVMDLPALITNQMTHERCLTTCQELQTKLAIISKNMCYCQTNDWAATVNVTRDFQRYKAKSCGNACSGNPHEKCAEPYPNFVYDSCMLLNQRLISSITIQFRLQEHVSPRHCLALCVASKQKYSYIQNRTCLCTDNDLKQEQQSDDAEDILLKGQNCSIPCDGNYLYSCGGEKNIYSMYMMQPKCNHGYEVGENDVQCVYSHFSSKTSSYEQAVSYCSSHGAKLAAVNDIVEIQDILPDSILHTRLMNYILLYKRFRHINDTRYF
ncbi:unnamed protein product, partial [Didymodactylos carnosus]